MAMIATYGLRGHEVCHIHRLPGEVEADAGVIEVGSFPSQGDGSATKAGHRCIWPHQAKPVLAHKEPGEDGAFEQDEGEGGALEAEDAGGDPEHDSARLHRRGSRGSQRVPMPQDVLQPLKS